MIQANPDPGVSMAHRQILTVLQSEIKDRGLAQPSILDIGCGDGKLLESLNTLRPSWLAGFDSSTYGLQDETMIGSHAPGGADIRRTAADGSWPFPDASFDIVVSSQVGEHVGDLTLFLAENARVLKAGGVAVHVFPTRHTLIEAHMHLPLVHRMKDDDLRSWTIARMSALGLGNYRATLRSDTGLTPEDYGRGQSDYIRRHTHYRTWEELSKAFEGADLCVTYRYTSMLVQRAASRTIRRKWDGRPLPSVIEAALFPLTRAISSVTFLAEKRDLYKSPWSRFGGGRAHLRRDSATTSTST